MTVKYSYCYDDKAKKIAHARLRTQLRKVARALNVTLERGMLRTNPGGIAVWGETTLHTDDIYIQADPSRDGVLVRSCKGRTDYTGGRNCYVSLAWLNRDPVEFARLARAAVGTNTVTSVHQMAGAYTIKCNCALCQNAGKAVGPYSGLTRDELRQTGTCETDWY